MSTSWGALRDAYLAHVRLYGGGRHVERAEQVLGMFTRMVDPVWVEEITTQCVQGYLLRRRQTVSRKTGQPLAPASINCDIRYLRACFAHAAQLGWDWQPPRIRLMREPRHLPRTVSAPGRARLFAAAENARRPVLPGITPATWWRCFLGLAFATGIRCRGLLCLPRPAEEWLDREELVLPAQGDKSGADRVFPLPLWAIALIRGMPAAPGERLLPWPHGVRYLYTELHRWQAAAGIPRAEHVVPHDLRRTLATEMLRARSPLSTVQQQLGHASPTTTARSYDGTVSEDRRQVIAAVPSPVVKPPRERQLEFEFA